MGRKGRIDAWGEGEEWVIKIRSANQSAAEVKSLSGDVEDISEYEGEVGRKAVAEEFLVVEQVVRRGQRKLRVRVRDLELVFRG